MVRALDYRVYRFRWGLAGRWGYTPAFPLHLDLELTNRCNLHCVMCARQYNSQTVQGYMSSELAMAALDEGAANGLRSVKFNWRGEPTLHPNLATLVAYAKRLGILETQLNTNGQIIDKHLAKDLVDAGLDRIIFSVDGASAKTYESIRVGGSYDRLYRNITGLVTYRKSRFQHKPLVRVQMVEMKTNTHEVHDFIECWGNGWADEVRVHRYSDRGGGGLGRDDQSRGERRFCRQPFQRLTVAWNGVVTGCCGDWGLQNALGSMKIEPLKVLWNSPKLAAQRDKLRWLEHQKIPGCANCFVNDSYKWEIVQIAK